MAARKRKRNPNNEFHNYRTFNVHRTSDHSAVKKAIDYLCAEIGIKTDTVKRQLKVVVCDLFYNYKEDATRYLSVYKSQRFYATIVKYNLFGISYRPMKQIVDGLAMAKHGYITIQDGYIHYATGLTEVSKMRATDKLRCLLEDQFNVTMEMIVEHKNKEIIILKGEPIEDKSKGKGRKNSIIPLVNYPETRTTRDMRSRLIRYNKLIAETFIDLDIQGYKYEKKRFNDKRDEINLIVNLGRKSSYRIFNGDFAHGGRFYGTWWQGCPEKLRQRIMIQGEHTHEIDFSGIHPQLLYAMEGSKLGDKEPYIIPKDNDPQKLRKVYKLILLTSVNCRSDKQCIPAVRKQLIEDMEESPDDWPEEIPDLESMLKELKDHHPIIRKWINQNMGLSLQKVDSMIVERVLYVLTKERIPVLSVHDSFICRASNADRVHQEMRKAFIEIATAEYSKTRINNQLDESDVMTKVTDIANNLFPQIRSLKSIWFLFTEAFVFNNQYSRRLITYIGSKKQTHDILTIKRILID